ncbi:MAG: ParB/RepB/Spo0J family partition protein [Candidatus Aminicenantes bacterium]|nr:ParB/RepB/Spo0J family partition protein [Candidatus Aminicenantes bacterium]
MVKKVGLPEFIKMKHDYHLVDEISMRTKTPVTRNIPIEKIITNQLQPRKDMGDLKELTESIREKGIIEPVIVRPKDGHFEIVAGERRFRAAKQAGLSEVPCIEHDIPDNEALELSIVENIQRKDLNVFEQAQSIMSLAEIYGYTHEEIAVKIGKSRVTVSELLRITDLPIEIRQKCLEMGINSKTFLLELTKLEDPLKMGVILEQYNQNSFSRDKIKQQRKKTTNLKTIKFNFVSEDKNIKINFHCRQEKFDRENIISVLEKLIADIKENKIRDFSDF